MSQKYCLTFFFLQLYSVSFLLHAQSTEKITGLVRDAETGKPLSGANIVVEQTRFGTTSNLLGQFVLEDVPEGTYNITASYIGYKTKAREIRVPRDGAVTVLFELTPEILSFPSVTVEAPAIDPSQQTNIQVVRLSEMENKSYRNILEALQQIPGVDISSTNGENGRSKISIRGSRPNQVLVLFDGVPLNDQLSGEANLAAVPISQVERIEVIKGGSSYRYGSGAMGGVIKIFSKKRTQNKLEFRGDVGSFGFQSLAPNLAINWKHFSLLFSIEQQKSDGNYRYHYNLADGTSITEKRTNADFDRNSLFTRAQFHFGAHRLSLQLLQSKNEQGLPGRIYFWTAYARTISRSTMRALSYQWEMLHWLVKGSYSNSSNREDYSNLWPDEADLRDRRYPRYHYRLQLNRRQLNLETIYSPRPNWTTQAGLEGQQLTYSDHDLLWTTGKGVGETRDHSLGIFMQQDLTANLYSSLSILGRVALRYDRFRLQNAQQTRDESHWSPGVTVSVEWERNPKWFLRYSWSQSFRAPTFADLFYQEVRIKGNPNLLPEVEHHQEAAAGIRFKKPFPLTADVSLFRDKIHNAITWRLGSFETFSPYNVDAEISGSEWRVGVATPAERISIWYSVVLPKPLNKSEERTLHNKWLPYRARKEVKASLKGKWRHAQISLDFRSYGNRYVTESNTVSLPPYAIVDLHFQWQLKWKTLQAGCIVGVLNLLDEDYQILEGMPMPPREFRFAIRIKH